MKQFGDIFLLLFLLLICSCSEFTENQKALVDKKWHYHRIGAIEFKSDKSYVIYYQNDSTVNFIYEFLEENKFRISNPKKNQFMDYFFLVKDSILYTVPVEDSLRKNDSFDTTFYHLNPKYEDWQARELFYFGKIISDKDSRGVPFVYFQF